MKVIAFNTETVQGVRDFLFHVTSNLNYHPDDVFNDFVQADENGKESYLFTYEEAKSLNKMNEKACSFCESAGLDIYGLSFGVWSILRKEAVRLGQSFLKSDVLSLEGYTLISDGSEQIGEIAMSKDGLTYWFTCINSDLQVYELDNIN